MTVPSPYRCREHPDEPVTWRGTGCASCATEERRAHASQVRWNKRRCDDFEPLLNAHRVDKQ